MNLCGILANEQYLTESCNCSVGVGDEVTVDGLTSRGTVVRRNGRRLTIQVGGWRGGEGYRNGYRFEKDQSFVHKMGKSPGELNSKESEHG